MTTLKNPRITISHRVVAFLLTWAILLTSMPYQRARAEDLSGIGIYNRVLTEQTGLQTTYKIKLYQTQQYVITEATEDEPAVIGYQYVEYPLSQEFELKDKSGKSLYLESSGEILMEQGQSVDFTDGNNTSFKNFLISHNITRIAIDVVTNEMRDGQTVEAYHQYPSTTDFSGSDAVYDSAATTLDDPADETPILSREIYKLQYETDSGNKVIKDLGDYKVKQYNLTPMVDCDVFVHWRDTKAERPEDTSIMFDVTRAETEGTAENYITGTPKQGADAAYGGVYSADQTEVQRSITEVDSNSILYTYSVPERSSNDKKYDYQATEHSITDYYIDTADDHMHFTNYHLTDYYCKVKWNDAAHPIHTYLVNPANANRIPDFIRSNFELLDETAEGHVYDALKVSESTLNEAGFPEETKKFIESTYEEVTETYYKLNSTVLDNIDGLTEEVKAYIRANCESVTEDNVTSFKISTEVLNSFAAEIKTLIQGPSHLRN